MNERVVVIDDEPYMVEILTTFLGINGYETTGAYTGEEGLALVEREQPDLVILDLMLPDIDGLDVCRDLRRRPRTADIPVLILSARTSAADVDAGMEVGATAYLKKPVDMPRLLSEIQRILREE